MKSIQIIAYTSGGEVRSAVDQVTERDYEASKEWLQEVINGRYLSFNTENGWAIIPMDQIHYVEIILV